MATHTEIDTDAAVRKLQRVARERRIRRAAGILSRLPLELQETIVTLVLREEVAARQCVCLRLDDSIRRVIMNRFEQCGVEPEGSLSCSRQWRTGRFDAHFAALTDAYDMAIRYRGVLSEEDVRTVLNAAFHHEQRCDRDDSAAWITCRQRMRAFASDVLAAKVGVPGDADGARHPNCIRPARVIESAITCTGGYNRRRGRCPATIDSHI